MKQITLFFICAIIFSGCKSSHEDRDNASDPVETSPNEALYNEVMKVHDEVMPKMNDIYKSQQQIKEKLQTPGLSEKEKQELTNVLNKLDSAGDGMMVWMRQFNPIPDSVGEEKARTYLEGEMEKVKRVREDIIEALNRAKTKTQ